MMNENATQTRRLALLPLGLSLGGFLAISFVGCILLGLITTDGALHRPWLQFFAGFEWLTARSVVTGLIWTQVYAAGRRWCSDHSAISVFGAADRWSDKWR
jgi:hypothetical protein